MYISEFICGVITGFGVLLVLMIALAFWAGERKKKN